MLGTGMIVVGFPLAFTFSTQARAQVPRGKLATVALAVTILALVAAVALISGIFRIWPDPGSPLS